MTSPRFIRTVAVIAMSAFALGAFVAGPADAKKKKKPAVCKAYQPGELGTDKPTLVVTDAATEEAPAVQKVTVAESAGDLDQVGIGEGPFAPGIDVFNIQVDSKAKEAGLHVLVEFADRNDVDLNLSYPDGSYAARAHGFQPILGTPAEADFGNTAGHAGESTTSSEHIVGLRTSDCGGWTVDVQNWLGMGGELDVKVWLGDIANDPQAAGAETP
jgi:hypothetical protein